MVYALLRASAYVCLHYSICLVIVIVVIAMIYRLIETTAIDQKNDPIMQMFLHTS